MNKFCGNGSVANVRSFMFSTNVGTRYAEPCTIAVAALHQILTQILLSLMKQVICADNSLLIPKSKL
jgi:hypothetical protein